MGLARDLAKCASCIGDGRFGPEEDREWPYGIGSTTDEGVHPPGAARSWYSKVRMICCSEMISDVQPKELGLAKRLGGERVRERLARESELRARKTHQGEGIFALERIIPLDTVIEWVLRLSGFYGMMHREFLDVRVVENRVRVPGLPLAFDGYRLLQVADLHCDLDAALIPRVVEVVDQTRFDLAVLTGDYHNKIGQCAGRSLDLMRELIPHLGSNPVGVMGNHDFLEKVSPLEAAGLRILLNEAVAVKRGGASLWIAGVDDPHFFEGHDFIAAKRDIPDGSCTILLSHSPETAVEAARAGFALHLSGHTHGGQICLPGGFPVIRTPGVPRDRLVGAWNCEGMPGYTSRGSGACGVAARWNCPPEVTVHILEPA